LIFVPIFVMILAAMRWGARRSPSPTGQEVIEKLLKTVVKTDAAC